MALISCPECCKEVSSLTKQCIHCGFPLIDEKENICLIDGEEHDLSDIKRRLMGITQDDDKAIYTIGFDIARQVGSISGRAGRELANIIMETGKVPKIYDGGLLTIRSSSSNKLRCPKCSSTNVSTGSRGHSLVFGFIGSGKTANRCGDCGYKWEPR